MSPATIAAAAGVHVGYVSRTTRMLLQVFAVFCLTLVSLERLAKPKT